MAPYPVSQAMLRDLDAGASYIVRIDDTTLRELSALVRDVRAMPFRSSRAGGADVGMLRWLEDLRASGRTAPIVVNTASGVHMWLRELLRVAELEPLPLTQYSRDDG